MDSGGRPRAVIREIAEHYPLVLHGVSLSIGSADPLNLDYLARLKRLADEVKPAWISDHLCWTGVLGLNSHDLLPMPLTEESLAHVAGRVRQVQDFLERPLILENPSSYVRFAHSTMDEPEFLRRLAEETGCGLLLDVNNVFVSCFNAGTDPAAYIHAFPCDRVVQMHLAGHQHRGTHIIDTHDRPVRPGGLGIVPAGLGPHRRRRHFAGMGRPHPVLRRMPCRAAEGQALHGRAVRARERAGPHDGGGADGVSNPVGFLVPRVMDSTLHGGGVSGDPAALQSVQQWMQDALVFPRRVERGAVGRMLGSSARLTGAEGLAVYQRGYFLRIASCMREQFPALCHALGEALFDDFVADYIRERPPESHTLYDLGRRFPAGSSRAGRTARWRRPSASAWIDFMIDLARLRTPAVRDVRRARPRGQAVRGRRHAGPPAPPPALLRARRLPLPGGRLLSRGAPSTAGAAAASPGELRGAGADRLCDPHHRARRSRITCS